MADIMRCPGVIPHTLQLPYSSRSERAQHMSERIPGRYSLVAEADGRVVGMAGLAVQDRPRRRHVADLGMAVHDDYQGQGVGSALMAALIELAEGWLGVERVELTVYTDNAPAIRLYQKFGFAIEGTARCYALRDGVFVDSYYMARLKGKPRSDVEP